MTQLTSETEPDRRLRLADGVTRSIAADDRILLRSPSGHFVAVPAGAEPLIVKLEAGCRYGELLQLVRGADPAGQAAGTADPGVGAFVDALRKSGLLEGQSGVHSRTDRFLARAGTDFFARLPLPVDIDRFAAAVARPARGSSARTLLIVAAVGSAAGVVGGLATVLGHRGELAQPPTTALVIVAALVLVQLAVHETFHAIAMRTQGARVREIGVGLLYYFVPVAYVDRTEAYAVRSRPGLVLIALAGPFVDATLIGVAALVALNADGDTHRVLVLYLTAELFLLVANCNPLFRSDGYHAIEAAFGALNMRARSFTILTNAVLRRPQPAHVRAMTRARRIGLVSYALGSVTYLVLMLWNLSHTILLTVFGTNS
jgi:putative peptide zinc metalloprotease protein